MSPVLGQSKVISKGFRLQKHLSVINMKFVVSKSKYLEKKITVGYSCCSDGAECVS